MTNFNRGKKLVEMARSKSHPEHSTPSLDKAFKLESYVNRTLQKSTPKELFPSATSSLISAHSNYESSIWTRPYSMTLPVFKKFNEYETSDVKLVDRAISKLKATEIFENVKGNLQSTQRKNATFTRNNEPLKQKTVCKDLLCYEEIESSSEDFDSDDSVKDKDYVPQEDISKNSSDSEEENDAASMVYSLSSTVHLQESDEEYDFEFVEKPLSNIKQDATCQNLSNESEKLKSLKLLCQNIINKYLQQPNECLDFQINKHNGNEKTSGEELVEVVVILEEKGISNAEYEESENDAKEIVEKKKEEENKKEQNVCMENNEQENSKIGKQAEIEGNKEMEQDIRMEDNDKNEENETSDNKVAEDREERNRKENSQLYNKSGNLRKRKMYDTSLAERQLAKKTKYREKFHIKEGCSIKCTKKCMQKFSENERKDINERYWNMTWKERRIFIQQSSYVSTPKRKITNEPKRFPKRTFFFKNTDQNQVDVCKIFYLTTLGYKSTNDKVLYNALGAENVEDNRGKYTRSTLIDRNIISQHIESFNPTISHYRREHAPLRKYLPSDLNVKMMHEDFAEKNPDVKISYDLYRKHLKTLNISFAQLGNEECEICEAHNIHCKSESHDKENLPADCQICKDYLDHKQRSVKARALYTEHKEKNEQELSHIFFSTDLEKVIMLPRMDTFKEVVFCQRLVAYNQTFAPLGKTNIEKPFAVLWHEAVAGRKQQDIISAFKAFFKQYRDYKYIDLWLDNCSAQNKNWLLYFFLVDLINSDEICATNITLNYFEKGHTYMSCDHFHHQVELSMKKKNKIYDYQDFVDAVAKANSGKVTVKEMQISDFIDICDFTSNRRIQTSTPRVYMKNIVQATFKRGSHNLFYKTDFDDEEYIETCFLKDTYLKPKNGPVSVTTVRETEKGIQLSRKMSIVSKLQKLMPPHKLLFWQNIPTNIRD